MSHHGLLGAGRRGKDTGVFGLKNLSSWVQGAGDKGAGSAVGATAANADGAGQSKMSDVRSWMQRQSSLGKLDVQKVGSPGNGEAVTAVDAAGSRRPVRGGDVSAVVSDGSLDGSGRHAKGRAVTEPIADVAAVGLTGSGMEMHGDVYVNVWLVDDAIVSTLVSTLGGNGRRVGKERDRDSEREEKEQARGHGRERERKRDREKEKERERERERVSRRFVVGRRNLVGGASLLDGRKGEHSGATGGLRSGGGKERCSNSPESQGPRPGSRSPENGNRSGRGADAVSAPSSRRGAGGDDEVAKGLRPGAELLETRGQVLPVGFACCTVDAVGTAKLNGLKLAACQGLARAYLRKNLC